MALSDKQKKLSLVIGFILITVLLGYLLFRVFFNGSLISEPEPFDPEIVATGTLPIAGEGEGQTETSTPGILPGSEGDSSSTPWRPGDTMPPDSNEPSAQAIGGVTEVTLVVDRPTIGLSNSSSGIQYYNTDDGLFYRLGADGQAQKISDQVFFSVQNVTWAPDGKKAVLEYPDDSKILYDFDKEKQVSFPAHWEEFSFSPQSDQVITKSIGLDPNNRFLTIASDDGSQVYNLEEIGTNADRVTPGWSPNNQIVATYTRSLDFNRQEVFFVGLHGENFKSTIVEGRGLTYEWSKTGDRLLYSAYNVNSDLKPLLWIVDAQGDRISQNRQSLGLNTWADKCAFANNTEIYCAVPTELEEGSGIFRSLAANSHDEIYKINLENRTRTLIAIPDGQYNINQVVVDESQNKLTFSDSRTGNIYQLKLK